MNRLSKISENISKIVVLISCITLSLVVLIIAVNVIGRAFNKPIPGGFDLSILCAAVSGSLAIAYTTQQCGHVSVDIITDILPPTLKKIQGMVTHLFALIIFAVLAWQGAIIFFERFHGELTETLRIPYWPFRLIWLLSMCCSVLFCITQFILAAAGGEK